ncbi:MAG TPA: TonB-dependent receptor, partial [Gemmatimonadaceae bacterium]
GRYTVRVSTPLMDSVGLAAVAREVDARTDNRVDTLRLPSARDLLFRACPRDSVANGEGMLRGSVRDTRAAPVANAAVVVTWQRNFDIIGDVKTDHVRFTEKTVGALTDETGGWRVCGVVRDVPLTVRVVADSGSDIQRTRLLGDFAIANLVVRRDQTAANREIDAAVGRASKATALVELAAFSLQGAPLPDVTLDVKEPKGQTRSIVTGATGRALLPGVEPGVLEIRARRIGFKQGTIAATIEPGRNTVPIILSEVAAPSLDTVRVVGNRRLSGLGRLDGFEQRRLTSIGGQFITRENIEKQAPIYTTDLLRRVPGVTLTDSSGVTIAISSRGMKMVQMKEGLVPVPCTMQVAVDGILKEGGFNLNSLNPADIHGIEVYTTATIPPQFNGAKRDSFCGLIVFWTR